jgi:hypothetical protein
LIAPPASSTLSDLNPLEFVFTPPLNHATQSRPSVVVQPSRIAPASRLSSFSPFSSVQNLHPTVAEILETLCTMGHVHRGKT